MALWAQGFPQWGDWGESPITTLSTPQKVPENNRENNSLLFLNNSLLLKISPLINLPGKTLGLAMLNMNTYLPFSSFPFFSSPCPNAKGFLATGYCFLHCFLEILMRARFSSFISLFCTKQFCLFTIKNYKR